MQLHLCVIIPKCNRMRENMLPKSLISFYYQVFKEKKWGISVYLLLMMFYKVTNYVMPALAVKFFVGALELKPVGGIGDGGCVPSIFVYFRLDYSFDVFGYNNQRFRNEGLSEN